MKAYHHSTRYQELPYSVKLYQMTGKIPKVPLEKSIDQLVSYLSRTEFRAFLQLIKETGLRGEEITRLTADDFDLEHRILTVNDPAKNTPCGQFKLSAKLVPMLYPLVHETQGRICRDKLSSASGYIRKKRKELAKQLNNQDILSCTPLGTRQFGS